MSNPVTFQQPSYSTPVRVDGIFGGDSQGRIREVVDMLKYADQVIDDVQITGKNGYGKVLSANVIHHPAVPVSPQVLQAAKHEDVSVDGIWGGDSCSRINSTVGTLKAAEQKILNVTVTGMNGYGKILGARIDYISSFQYDSLMNSAPPFPSQQTATKPA